MKFIALKTKDGSSKGNITFFCRVLHVSRQGYYQYLVMKDRPWKYQPLADAMKDILTEDICNDTYGRTRMYQALTMKQPKNVDIPSERTVYRVMEEIGISHHPRRKPNGITKADREARKSEDLLKRDFHAEEPLTETIIKELHRILKQSTKDSTLSWFAVGDYKRRGNTVGGHETTKPKDVPARMKKLLSDYGSLDPVSMDYIIQFHYEFECIHPFQDGNGRVGRLIALKECLRYGIVPFIIEDSKKLFYYRGLAQWKTEKGYLTDTCLDGQDTFKKMMSMFDIQP